MAGFALLRWRSGATVLAGALALSQASCSESVTRSLGSTLAGARLGRGDYGHAAVVAGTGVVLYAAAGGCKISGCPGGTYCDAASERCVRLECTLSNEKDICVAGTHCNLSSGSCVAF